MSAVRTSTIRKQAAEIIAAPCESSRQQHAWILTVKHLHADGYSVADNLLAAFAGAGFWPEAGDKILDFGCGAGRLVYEFRDRGFDAFGFDLHSRPELRQPSDADLFSAVQAPHAQQDTSDTQIDSGAFRTAFDDHSFDIIVSTSVLEHVLDLDSFVSETARLLKPGGFAYHLYPNKNVFIEPHIFVPFASRIQTWPYFYLWALIGIRNQFQRGMPAREVADNNVRYCKTGLRYRTRRQLFRICARHFHWVRFVDNLYYPGIGKTTFLRNRWNALRSDTPLISLSQTLKLGSILTHKFAE
jgi:2-polyprenyl-3-methyl-5-hydroxy-6-metoxy-1,4-benzoquinol methylase